VRQPLSHVAVSLASGSEERSLERIKPQILEELNVKDIKDVIIRPPTAGISVSVPAPVIVTEGDYSVAVPTEISPQLQAEGMAREIVHRLQTMRRSAGFDIADRIVTYYQGEAYIRQVMEDFADYIKQETLSLELVEGVPPEGAFTDTHKLGGYEILLGVKRERPG
jgi:isoleucyl-tRNA synthetase